MLKKIVCGLILIASFSGCLKSKSSSNATCNYDPCAYKAPAAEIQSVQDYLTTKGITATQHCSGFFYVIDSAGTGKTPSACNYVNATYTGKLTNDSTFDQGTHDFPLNQVILGWTNGIPLLKEGGRIRLYIPPSLGYANKDVKDSNGNVVIPANSILIFDVTLNGVY